MLPARWHVAARTTLTIATTTQRVRQQHRALHVGVLGLGAIGTIFFGQLAQYAEQRARIDSHGAIADPSLLVSALVKPSQRAKLAAQRQVALYRSAVEDGRPVEQVLHTISVEPHGQMLVSKHRAACIRALEEERDGDGTASPIDVVLVALKAYDSARALEELQRQDASRFAPDAMFVLLQNGLGALPTAFAATPQTRQWTTLNGVTYVGGRAICCGKVVASGLDRGKTYLAFTQELRDESGKMQHRLKEMVDVLCAAGLQSEMLSVNEMKGMLWKKLIVNAAINTIACILDAPNRAVAASPSSRHCVEAIVHEAYAVAEQEGASLDISEQAMVQQVLQVAENTGANICSMLADLRSGNPTEIDAITGAIVRAGELHDIPTPVNAFVQHAILAKSAATNAMHPGRLEQ